VLCRAVRGGGGAVRCRAVPCGAVPCRAVLCVAVPCGAVRGRSALRNWSGEWRGIFKLPRHFYYLGSHLSVYQCFNFSQIFSGAAA